MLVHKLIKGKPKCNPKGWIDRRVLSMDPRLRYQWDDVTCPECLKTKHNIDRMKKYAVPVDDEDESATELARVDAMAKEILQRHVSGEAEDFFEDEG